MRGECTDRNHVNIDSNMIKYMVRAVTYFKYMPKKPTKDGIKVFSIFCALCAIILGLKVYVGQEDYSDNIALVICDDLVKESGITRFRGLTLYTDNYYTSMSLAKHMFNYYII